MRISDWSSDVCSSDLIVFGIFAAPRLPARQRDRTEPPFAAMVDAVVRGIVAACRMHYHIVREQRLDLGLVDRRRRQDAHARGMTLRVGDRQPFADRKSTRLNSSH